MQNDTTINPICPYSHLPATPQKNPRPPRVSFLLLTGNSFWLTVSRCHQGLQRGTSQNAAVRALTPWPSMAVLRPSLPPLRLRVQTVAEPRRKSSSVKLPATSCANRNAEFNQWNMSVAYLKRAMNTYCLDSPCMIMKEIRTARFHLKLFLRFPNSSMKLLTWAEFRMPLGLRTSDFHYILLL